MTYCLGGASLSAEGLQFRLDLVVGSTDGVLVSDDHILNIIEVTVFVESLREKWCVCGVLLVCYWCVIGVFMVCLWCVCGVLMACLWCVCGEFVVSLWCVCGEFVVCLWCVCGEFVVSLW